MRARVIMTALAAALACSGCIDPDDRPAEWPYIHAAIVVPSCATATCHSSLGARAGLVLEEQEPARRALLEERFVVPGDETSALLYLLDGRERVRMPPDAPLPRVDVDLIRAWIRTGAQP